MVPHTINTTAAYIDNCTLLFNINSAIYINITGSYSQNIIINAKANKYQQNHNQTILP